VEKDSLRRLPTLFTEDSARHDYHSVDPRLTFTQTFPVLLAEE